MKAPTGYTGKPARNQNLPPKVIIELEWVHGYRGSNNRNNMGLIKDGSLAYYAAAVGIVYDPV
jgi:microtubule-associated protein-like 1/2